MALNFVAAEDGLEDGPKFLTLARILKVPRSTAFWCLMRLRRLIVNEGNVENGAFPKNYDAGDIAAFLEWSGRTAVLIDALKLTGFLGFQRGRGFFIPGWERTTTGCYAQRLAFDRERKKASRGGGASGEIENSVHGPSVDVRGQSVDVLRKTDINKERTSADAPPNPPRDGGDSLADARWQWVLDHAENPQNSEYCRPILARMSSENWALVQAAWGVPKEKWGPLYRRNARVLAWPSDAFLRKQAFLRWRPKPPPRAIVRAASEVVKVISPADVLERRLAEQDSYVVEALADPDQSEEKKRELRKWWEQNPENAERSPPWKKPNGQHTKDLT